MRKRKLLIDFENFKYNENKEKDINNLPQDLQIEKIISKIEDDKCVFCGGKKITNRACCSSACAKKLEEYSSISIPIIIIKKIHKLKNLKEKIDKIKDIAKKEKISFEACSRYYIFVSKKMNTAQKNIGLTMKIACYYGEFKKIPSILL